jgi:hypothetical protein
MRRLPPLTALRAFEAAARHLSFKAAADEVGLTPTAISHQIRLLETIAGGALFRRRPRPLALTSAGAALFPVVRNNLEKIAEAFAAVCNKVACRQAESASTDSHDRPLFDVSDPNNVDALAAKGWVDMDLGAAFMADDRAARLASVESSATKALSLSHTFCLAPSTVLSIAATRRSLNSNIR